MRQSLLLTTVLTIISLSIPAEAQRQNDIWYFGANAGIDFSTSPPTPLTNGAMATYEGCATICNPLTGKLLFYTDGSTVWNRNHLPMVNGTGLRGGSSSTQSALIVPAPEDSNRYYIFTSAPREKGAFATDGIQYATVNMANDGGLGGVFPYGRILIPGTEKLTSVQHCNGRDIWVITHTWGSDEFVAFLVTPQGVSRDPVVSSAGPALLDSNTIVGALVASPNGQKLAMALSDTAYPLQIYDFDTQTGIVSNAVTLSTGEREYGVCFSPGSSKLYATAVNKLYQYDLSSNQPGTMASSKTEIYAATDQLQGMELGPDSLVYVTRPGSAKLGRVTKPESPGLSCNYVHDGFDLLGKYSEFDLPNRVVVPRSGPVVADPILTRDTTICAGQGLRLQARPGLTYEWTPVDDVNCPTCRDPIATPDTTMFFRLAASNGICTVVDSVLVRVVQPPTIIAYNDTTICVEDSVRLFAYGADRYRWEPADGLSCTDCPDPMAHPTTTTRYFVTGTNIYGCSSAATVLVTVATGPPVDAGPDTAICLGAEVRLHATGGTSLEWKPSTGLSCTTCSDPIARPETTTTYRVILRSEEGCPGIDSVTVTVHPPPDVDAGPDRSLCLGDSVALSASGGTTYLWSPTLGLSCSDCPDPIAFPSSTTTYVVTAFDDIGCPASDSVVVSVSSSIVASVSDDVSICRGDSTKLIASGGTTFAWSPATGLSCSDCPDPVATPEATTRYTVVVSGSTSGNCSNDDSASVTVSVSPGPQIHVDGKTTICRNGSTRLVASGATSYQWTPAIGLSCADCPDPVVSPTTSTTYSIVAFNDLGCADSASVSVRVVDPPTVSLSDDTTICAGGSARLHAVGARSFSWSPTDGLDCSDCSDPVARPSNTTRYIVTAFDSLGCAATDSVTVSVSPLPTVVASPDTTICAGDRVLLSATASNAASVLWSPADGLDCPACISTAARPTTSTTYIVSVFNDLGCSASDSLSVSVDPGSLSARATINRTLRVQPASFVRVPVRLLDPLDAARISSLDLTISFDPRILRFAMPDLGRTLLDGWKIDNLDVDDLHGTISARFSAPTARTLDGSGPLLYLIFRGFLGSVDSSEISFQIGLPEHPCTVVETSPGLVRIDSICGLSLRLIEGTAENYSLEQNRPNPFNPTTEISFSLGLDGPTRLAIFDRTGRHVATLVDQRLEAGRYLVTWDASDEPSGMYYYRLDSGDWSRSGVMTLVK